MPRPPRFVVALPLDPARSVCLDCIVTVVDARHIRRQLADPRPDGAVNEAQQQVAFADVVLLNKVCLPAGAAGLQAGGARRPAVMMHRAR